MIIAIYGKIGSGKSFAAKYISKKYKYEEYSMGDEIRKIAKNKKLIPTRYNLSKISTNYKKKYGNDYWIKKLMKSISNKKIIVSGIRSVDDYLFLKNKYKNIVLIEIYSKNKLREKRMIERNREGDPKNKLDFIKQNLSESVLFSDYYKFEKYVDYKLENNENSNILYKNIDKLFHQKSLY
tara:strand:+ start:35 stop:577 length:543 start_codon:yes stop_codon:yes gene_type:complete